MIQAKCIQKFRNKNNQIVGYRLQDQQGNTKDATSDQLKTAIQNKQITIINLTLTSDNRLVDTTPTTNQQPQQSISNEEQYIKDLLAKAKLIGAQVKEISTFCNHKCILISLSDTNHIIYIPNNVTKLNKNRYNFNFTEHIQKLQGTIKVTGGHNLQDTIAMFNQCQAQSLDLSSFNTSKVTDMRNMFRECQAQSIDLSSFNTSSVKYMSAMFYKCQAKSLDLSSFNTSKVTNMNYMFNQCQAQSLDLSSFNTSKVKSMISMFYGCKAQSLDLSSFNTSNVKKMDDIFRGCKAQIKATDQKILEAYKGGNQQ